MISTLFAIIIVGAMIGVPRYKKLLGFLFAIWLILSLIVEMKGCMG